MINMSRLWKIRLRIITNRQRRTRKREKRLKHSLISSEPTRYWHQWYRVESKC